MFVRIQLWSLLATILYLVMIIWSVRQKRLKEAYALLWLFSGVVMLIVSVWPGCLQILSDWLGIYYPPVTLLLLMLGGVVLVLFQYSQLLSRNQEKISRLAQEIALLSQKIEALKKKE